MQSNYDIILGEYEKILETVKKEREYIDNSRFDDLNEILGTKTNSIERIEETNGYLTKIIDEICNVLNVKEIKLDNFEHIIPDVVYNNLYETQKRLKTLLSEIISKQDENQRILTDNFGELKNDIIKIKTGKKVVDSYSSTAEEYESRFIDKLY